MLRRHASKIDLLQVVYGEENQMVRDEREREETLGARSVDRGYQLSARWTNDRVLLYSRAHVHRPGDLTEGRRRHCKRTRLKPKFLYSSYTDCVLTDNNNHRNAGGRPDRPTPMCETASFTPGESSHTCIHTHVHTPSRAPPRMTHPPRRRRAG